MEDPIHKQLVGASQKKFREDDEKVVIAISVRLFVSIESLRSKEIHEVMTLHGPIQK